MQSSTQQWWALAGFLAVTFAVQAIASFLTFPAVTAWYPGLQKPSWTPPGWVFGPVWTALYISMGVAAWLVWGKQGFAGARWPLLLFGVQLVLNGAWSGLFFALRNPGAAFFEIVLLWCAILGTMISFWQVSLAAGWLFVPYLLWVSYAAVLNFAIWRLNS